jgi:cell cycle sensor histidine kinase DivJ
MAAVRAKNGIDIAVSDTGVGISQKDLEKLGKPFEQAEGAHTRTQEGTGLGLALVKAFAGMHGGDAAIMSTLGEGTTVRVHLPYAAISADGKRMTPQAKVVPLRGAA